MVLFRSSSLVVRLGYGVICKKTFIAKVDVFTKSDAGGYFAADIVERVCGSVMANYVGDYVSVNYFAELPSP